MNRTETNPALELVFHQTLTAWDATWFFVDLGVNVVIVVPLLALASTLRLRPFGGFPATIFLIFAGLFGLIIILLLFVMLSEGLPCWTLHVDRRRITLTHTTLFWMKATGIDANGAKCRAVYYDFFGRFFSWKGYVSPYTIEISRNGETLRFPCVNEEDQRENLAKIEQILNSNNSRKGAAASHFAAGD